MKKLSVLLLAPLLLVGCASSNNGQVPRAQQIADLQDDDGDGVINARDKCNSTPLGAEVDNDGCETFRKPTAASVKSAKQQLNVLFPHDSSIIPVIFVGQLKEMANFLKTYPETSIELQGYASMVGDAKYNQWLSERRADSVKNQLLSQGIDDKRVKITGYGKAKAVSEKLVDQALDRKVIATVVGKDVVEGQKGDVVNRWTIFTKRNK